MVEIWNGILHIDDMVNDVFNVITQKPKKKYLYNIYYIGNSNPINLMDFITTIENEIGKKTIINFQPLRKGAIYKTYASTKKLQGYYNYVPAKDIRIGIKKFVD